MPPVSTRLMYPASVSSLPILRSSSCCVRPLAFRSNANLSRNNSPAFRVMRSQQYEEQAKGYRSANVEKLLPNSTFNVDSRCQNAGEARRAIAREERWSAECTFKKARTLRFASQIVRAKALTICTVGPSSSKLGSIGLAPSS